MQNNLVIYVKWFSPRNITSFNDTDTDQYKMKFHPTRSLIFVLSNMRILSKSRLWNSLIKQSARKDSGVAMGMSRGNDTPNFLYDEFF